MKAIPTHYKGIHFRSRLEAKYQAFFDVLGFQTTYEPELGRGYLPDFLIHGFAPIMVEVKPVATQEEYEDVLLKVATGLENRWHNDILIVGLDPIAGGLDGCCKVHPAVGLMGRGREFRTASWYRCRACTALAIDHADGIFEPRPCGHDGGVDAGGPAVEAVAAAWIAAGNAVRWQPRR